MTDRHIHCVFCEKVGNDEFKCLKHNKHFPAVVPIKLENGEYSEGWFEPHCDDYIPKPCLLLSYYIYESKNFPLEKLEDCYKEANEFLERHNFIKKVNKNE